MRKKPKKNAIMKNKVCINRGRGGILAKRKEQFVDNDYY